jgi:nicotinamidase-related amidase
MRGLDNHQRPALLISECQNQIINPDYTDLPLSAQVAERGILARINELAAQFRALELPVIFCNIAAPPNFEGFVVNCLLAALIKKEGRLVTGTAAAAIHDDLKVEPTDIVNERMHGMAAFSGTELESILRGHRIDTVVLTGVSTNVAIPGAATEAIARGFEVIVAEDCTAGGTVESHHMQVTMHLPLLATVTPSQPLIADLNQRFS